MEKDGGFGTRKVVKNIGLSLFAQAVSLGAYFVLLFLVPKYIDEYQYSYWQTYSLYAGYVGFLHFGLLDGILVKYSKQSYQDLEKDKVSFDFLVLFIWLSLCSAVLFIIGLNQTDYVLKYVLIFVSLSILSKNICSYFSYIFQMTNRIKNYASIVIVQKLSVLLFTLFLLYLHETDFVYFCIVDIAGDILAVLIIGIPFNWQLLFSFRKKTSGYLKDFKAALCSGFFIMLSNLSNLFIIGFPRTFVKMEWGTLVFGQFSFAVSVSSLFLSVISAISIVFFPTIRRTDVALLPSFYYSLRTNISKLMMLCLLFYFPGALIIGKWLPKYSLGVQYLGLLLPMVLFTTVENLMTINYLKAFGKEKKMALVGLFCTFLSLAVSSICIFIIKDICMLAISLVAVYFLKLVFSERFLDKENGHNFLFLELSEFLVAIVFSISTWFLSGRNAMAAYSLFLLCFFVIHKQISKKVVNKVSRQ